MCSKFCWWQYIVSCQEGPKSLINVLENESNKLIKYFQGNNMFVNLDKFGLSNFTTYDPTIQNQRMQDSRIKICISLHVINGLTKGDKIFIVRKILKISLDNSKRVWFLFFKEATSLYFTYDTCALIIFYNTGLCKSAFSTCHFWKLVFPLFVVYVFPVC